MNYSRATYRTASALRNPVSTGSAGCLVGSVMLVVHLFVMTAVLTWWSLKFVGIIFWAVAMLVTKGSTVAGETFRKCWHQYLVGAGEITQGDVRDLESRPDYKPGQWYPTVGVIPKDDAR